MKTSTALFELIQSMSKTEKGYFKKFTARYAPKEKGQKNNYIRLFEAIDRQKTYHEPQLLQQFAKEKFVKNFAWTKKYLYDQILTSLEAFHASKSEAVQVKQLIGRSQILYNRGMFKQCQKLLSKAKKKALTYEYLLLLLEIFSIERKLIVNLETKNVKKKLGDLLQQRHAVLRQIQNKEVYLELNCRLYIHAKSSMSVHSPEVIAELNNIIQHPLLQKKENALSFIARTYYYSCNSIYHNILGQAHKAYEYAKNLVQLWEQFPHFKKESPARYISSINNFLIRCRRMQKYEESVQYLNALRDINTGGHVDLEIKQFLAIYNNQMSLLVDQKKYEKAILLLPEMEEWLETYENKLSKEWVLAFYVNATDLHFRTGKYEEALIWVNKILSNENIGIRKDLYTSARLLKLVLHHELQHDFLVEHFSRSTQRFMEKTEPLSKLEKNILSFIKKAAIKNPPPSTIDYAQLREELTTLATQKTEQKLFSFFDYIGWLDRKLAS